MVQLIENELYKMLMKKKLILISSILIILILLFSYGENYLYKANIKKYSAVYSGLEKGSWKPFAVQKLSDLTVNLNNSSIKNADKSSIYIQIKQMEYYLANDINPLAPTAAKFTVRFMQQAVFVFLPLLTIILSGDCVSGEFSSKTIKALLTRAVPRWKILLSKYIALLIMFSVVVLEMAFTSILISFCIFHKFGWLEPVATGYRTISGKIDTSNLIMIKQWQYLVLVYSLGWFVANVVGTISFMISVLVRNTSTSIGVMMASLVGGGFLQLFVADWPIVRYFFVSNINLPQYLSGSYHPVKGMNLFFSTIVLLIWLVSALIVSFIAFENQDVLV